MTILKISKQGLPLAWITPAMAATMIVKDQVAWSLGDNIATLYGGRGRDGLQSVLWVPAIIASKGRHRDARFTPALNNALLFRRDNNQCLYCGEVFSRKVLTRDHVIPRAQGGPRNRGTAAGYPELPLALLKAL